MAMAFVFHVLNGAKVLIILDALFSWVMDEGQFPRSVTKAILDPVYTPMRSLLGARIGPVDLCPLIALGLLYAFDAVLKRSGHREPR